MRKSQGWEYTITLSRAGREMVEDCCVQCLQSGSDFESGKAFFPCLLQCLIRATLKSCKY